MRILAAVCCGLVVAAAAVPVAAGPFDRGFRPYMQAQGQGQGQGQRQRQGPGPAPQREADRPTPQRDTRGTGEADRGRMSPDERRQLRRDIQDAGRDIYHPARQVPEESRRSRRR